MVSIGPNSQVYNYTHAFDFTDLRGKLPQKVPCENSLLDYITRNPDYSIFLYLVKISNQEAFLNNLQAQFTLFVPSNEYLQKKFNRNIFTNMDPGTAYSIVKSSLLKYRMSSEVLEDSPQAYFYTMSEENRLMITNISGKTYINGNIEIIKKDIVCKNGIIHITDGLFIPNII